MGVHLCVVCVRRILNIDCVTPLLTAVLYVTRIWVPFSTPSPLLPLGVDIYFSQKSASSLYLLCLPLTSTKKFESW